MIEPRIVDLNTTIREAADAPTLDREDLALETQLDGSLGQVMADPDQLHQVIVNLAVQSTRDLPAR